VGLEFALLVRERRPVTVSGTPADRVVEACRVPTSVSAVCGLFEFVRGSGGQDL